MALIQCQFFSEVLSLSTSMTVILPQQTSSQIGMQNRQVSDKHKTLYLLHGFSDDDTIWTRRTSIERYVAPLGLAVVMPQVHQSFYTDMKYGNKYWTFLTEELPEIARSFFPLSEKREDNFVAGLSMGGYGAFKWALRHPDKIAAAASLSGAVDMANWIKQDGHLDDVFKLIYGDEDIKDTDNDLLWLLEQGERNPEQPKPALYQCCGTEDFLYESNLTFKKKCEQTSYSLTTDFGPGTHEWGYWEDKIQDVLKWLPLAQY
ncbi:alpha/beta hydrolase [Metabacillus niabensis]|uniref:S-formylglutathione hydrolase FrmB n=1 Tax=Metabacillus niabensis TaxID=324854 RepID=A0ABT9Z1A3_9BACI|nr:alpha/beta hydrolase family protein [Metabacillus niabensis]MDQ0225607.1 S-formylglutathione hydrolase FrmB [Metabacillus niabensis]